MTTPIKEYLFRHRLSEIDPISRTAICSVCGPGTELKPRGIGRWVCVHSKRDSGTRDRRKAWLRYNKPTVCVFCGYNRCTRSIDMHHVHPKEKKFNPSKKIRKRELLIAEFAKCICVCRNCHGEIHAGLISQTEVEAKPRVMIEILSKPEKQQKDRSEQRRELHQRKRDAGICFCCSHLAVPGKLKCQKCKAKEKTINAEQRKKRKLTKITENPAIIQRFSRLPGY